MEYILESINIMRFYKKYTTSLFLFCSLLYVSKINAAENNPTIIMNKNQKKESDEIAEACLQGDSKKVIKWIKSGGNVNLGTEEGFQLICIACAGGNLYIIQTFIHAGADIKYSVLGDKLLISVGSDKFSYIAERMKEEVKYKTLNHTVYPKAEIVKILIKGGVNMGGPHRKRKL